MNQFNAKSWRDFHWMVFEGLKRATLPAVWQLRWMKLNWTQSTSFQIDWMWLVDDSVFEIHRQLGCYAFSMAFWLDINTMERKPMRIIKPSSRKKYQRWIDWKSLLAGLLKCAKNFITVWIILRVWLGRHSAVYWHWTKPNEIWNFNVGAPEYATSAAAVAISHAFPLNAN